MKKTTIKPRATEAQARAGIRQLREKIDTKKFPEIGKLADSLERLVDGAARGGNARAKKLTKKRRKEIATNAANARWGK